MNRLPFARFNILFSRLLMVGLLWMALLPAPATASAPRSEVPSLAPMLEQVMPGVVNISTKSHVAVARNPLFDDPFFRRFFNVPNMPQQQERQSLGSGVVVDAENGYVITNHHVIGDADEITVTLRDGRDLEAKLIGSDPEADLAIVQVDADNLTAVPLADSEALRIGDYVVAIGNPFGLGQTVTSGIVSALGRTGLGIEGFEDFIQTDASINPGNSGGALVNLHGELVGINTAIVGPSGGNVGIGFAIPSNMARSIMNQLIEFGEVRRGKLGIIIQDLTPELAELFDVAAGSGVIVSQVLPDTPAEDAGMKAGDVITAVNGEAVHSVAELRNAIGLHRVGAKVKISLVRDGDKKTLKVKIGGDIGEQASAKSIDPRLDGAVLGPIPDNHPLFGRVDGIAVLEVRQGSRAAAAGLRQGDVITSLNRQLVASLKDARKAIKKASGSLLLHVQRGERALFIVIR